MPLSAQESRLCDAIARRGSALVDDLRLHVGLPTGGGNRAALEETRERLTSRLQKLGARTELIPGSPKPDWLHGVAPGGWIPPTAVCRNDAGRRGTPILLSGHMDTVHDPRGTFRELTLSSGGAKATGPGCVDMKGGLVIAMAALEALADAGIAAPWTFILNSDEETGSYHSEGALRAEARRTHAARGLGLVFEPALPDGSLAVERLGSGQFLIQARGRSAHVGRDFEKGISAVTALSRAVLAAADLPDPARGKIANIGPLEGGSATNIVPDRARAWGNVRYPSKPIADELEAGLRRLETAKGTLPEVTVQTSFNRPAKPLTPEVQRLADAARRAAQDLGQPLPFGKTGGVCDGNILQDEGLPTIDTLGVRGGGLHTTDEWIDIPSLVERCQLTALLISRIGSDQ